MNPRSCQALFRPLELSGLTLRNRVAMAPMTRSFSPDGIPGADVAAYYRRRAEGGTGLIITEGIAVPEARSCFDPKVPRLEGESIAAWRTIVEQVHAAGATIFAQLWHIGAQVRSGPPPPEGVAPANAAMPVAEIEAVLAAFGEAAATAKSAGFDGVEIHGAHGYLVDQFLWAHTNQRKDSYGGSPVARARFAAKVVAEIRRRVGPGYPVALRFSQFKVEDYSARIANSAAELDRMLARIVDAGADVLHASARRFWEPAFNSSPLTLAGWTKKLTGLPTISVGSVTLGTDVMTSFDSDDPAACTGIDTLLDCMERGEFDMIAVGRAIIANPDWAQRVQAGEMDRLRPFSRTLLETLF
jgi:2,4-dienoyl-CoA reductase-like NADH-dependent reductase (Old Yellow Enzyme family)